MYAIFRVSKAEQHPQAKIKLTIRQQISQERVHQRHLIRIIELVVIEITFILYFVYNALNF